MIETFQFSRIRPISPAFVFALFLFFPSIPTHAESATTNLHSRIVHAVLHSNEPHFDKEAGLLLKAGTHVHDLRSNLLYASALLQSGDSLLKERGEKIVQRVLALQETKSNESKTGTWPATLEEPGSGTGVDFYHTLTVSCILLDMICNPSVNLSEELKAQCTEAVRRVISAIKTRPVSPSDLNGALPEAYLYVTVGRLIKEDKLVRAGEDAIEILASEVTSFAVEDFNSPTYTTLLLKTCGDIVRNSSSERAVQAAEKMIRFWWDQLSRHFHPPTLQLMGPSSRSGDWDTRQQTALSSAIWLATEGDLYIHSVPAEKDPSYALTALFFSNVPKMNVEQKRRVLNLEKVQFRKETMFIPPPGSRIPVVESRVFMHSKFGVATASLGDTWFDRENLAVVWGKVENPGFLKMVLLQENRILNAGVLRTSQTNGTVLCILTFADDIEKNFMTRAEPIRLQFHWIGLPSVYLENWKSTGQMLAHFSQVNFQLKVGKARIGNRQATYRLITAPEGYPIAEVVFTPDDQSPVLERNTPAYVVFALEVTDQKVKPLEKRLSVQEEPIRIEATLDTLLVEAQPQVLDVLSAMANVEK